MFIIGCNNVYYWGSLLINTKTNRNICMELLRYVHMSAPTIAHIYLHIYLCIIVCVCVCVCVCTDIIQILIYLLIFPSIFKVSSKEIKLLLFDSIIMLA